MTSVNITVPVLNESNSLSSQIRILIEYLDRLALPNIDWEITIADNGSTDATEEIGRELSSRYSLVRYLRLPEKGVGRALKASWAASTADIVGYMDLDLATDLAHLQEAIRALNEEGYDIVYASRLHPRAQVIGRSVKRELVSRTFNLILRTYLGTRVSDGMCGFKFLRRSVYPTLVSKGAISDGWFFSTELLVVGESQGLRMYELPVKWTDDPNSRVKVVPLAISYLKSMKQLHDKVLNERRE